MERNAMTSFRILSSFECFLRYFEIRITTSKFDWQKPGTHISQITTFIFKIILNTLTFIQILFLFLFNLVCNLVILKNIFIIQFAIIII